MTYDFAYKRVQFSDLVALDIPAQWHVTAQPDFDWICHGDDADTSVLSVNVQVYPLPDGAIMPNLKDIVDDMAAKFPAQFGKQTLESTVSEFRHGYLYKVVGDSEKNDGSWLRTYRYAVVQFHADILAIIFISLVVSPNDVERSDVADQISKIEESVQGIDLLLYSKRRIPLPELDELQTIMCGDAMSLRIPARWNFETNRDEEEGWCCYRRGEETGTLWIAINRFRRPTPDESPDFSPRGYLDSLIATRLANKAVPIFDSKVAEIESGYLWSYDFTVTENGADLHYFRHIFLVSDDIEVAIVAFSFVVLEAQLTDRAIRKLVSIVDREVRAAELTVLSDEARAKGAVAFPITKSFDFGGKIRINLPNFIDVSWQGENRGFYCSFRSLTASMWIRIEDVRLSDNPYDDDGSIPPEIFESLEDYFIDGPKEEADIIRFANGFMIRSTYDDDDEIDDPIADPAQQWKRYGFRNHLWRYFHIGTDIVRQAQFLLMLPIREPEKRDLVALVKILDSEIPQAQFPDIN